MTRETIRALLLKSGAHVECGPSDFGKPFKDVGLDSLDVYNFLIEVETEIGREISDEEFEAVRTLDELIDLVNKPPEYSI